MILFQLWENFSLLRVESFGFIFLIFEDIQIEFDSIMVEGLVFHHVGEVGPFWVEDGVVDVLLYGGVVEGVKVLD